MVVSRFSINHMYWSSVFNFKLRSFVFERYLPPALKSPMMMTGTELPHLLFMFVCTFTSSFNSDSTALGVMWAPWREVKKGLGKFNVSTHILIGNFKYTQCTRKNDSEKCSAMDCFWPNILKCPNFVCFASRHEIFFLGLLEILWKNLIFEIRKLMRTNFSHWMLTYDSKSWYQSFSRSQKDDKWFSHESVFPSLFWTIIIMVFVRYFENVTPKKCRQNTDNIYTGMPRVIPPHGPKIGRRQ